MFWINGNEPDLGQPLMCKHRYRQSDQACTIEHDNDGYQIHFEQPQRAVTPGQSAVIYQGGTCLGGGVIEEAWR